MTVTIGSFRDRATELFNNTKLLKELVATYIEQSDFLKMQENLSEKTLDKINELYDKMRKAFEFVSQLEILGEKVDKLAVRVTDWNETIDQFKVDEKTLEEYNVRLEKYLNEKNKELIPLEDAAEIYHVMKSAIAIVENAEKNGVLTVPLGVTTGNEFLEKLTSYMSIAAHGQQARDEVSARALHRSGKFSDLSKQKPQATEPAPAQTPRQYIHV
jgi:vacuolar-type H+-ATPase subunit I/STV1